MTNHLVLGRNVAIILGLAFGVAFAFGRISEAFLRSELASSGSLSSPEIAGTEAQKLPNPVSVPTPAPTVEPKSAPIVGSKSAPTATHLKANKVSQAPKPRPKTFTARSSAVLVRNWQGLQISGNTIKVSRKQFDHLTTKGLKPILQTARMEPVIEGNKMLGFALVKIARGSVWEAAGYQKNDLFKSVNGIPLSNVPQSLKILQAMKRVSKIRIEYVRQNRTYSQTIHIQ